MTAYDPAMSFAHISDDGLYRYRLERLWDDGRPIALFVMLNPSTADAMIDDPTIRRCIGFAKTYGMGGIEVVNLYALRATNPKHLWTASDPVGPLNDEIVEHALQMRARHGGLTVAAWGANAKPDRVEWFRSVSLGAHCLGSNKDGSPKHPLYLAAATALDPWPKVA